jgi:hypothetical protein
MGPEINSPCSQIAGIGPCCKQVELGPYNIPLRLILVLDFYILLRIACNLPSYNFSKTNFVHSSTFPDTNYMSLLSEYSVTQVV